MIRSDCFTPDCTWIGTTKNYRNSRITLQASTKGIRLLFYIFRSNAPFDLFSPLRTLLLYYYRLQQLQPPFPALQGPLYTLFSHSPLSETSRNLHNKLVTYPQPTPCSNLSRKPLGICTTSWAHTPSLLPTRTGHHGL